MKRVLVFTTVLLYSGPVLALTFMGPPTSDFIPGQFGLGFEYSNTTENADLDTYLARLVFGVADGVEMSFRAGAYEVYGTDDDFVWGLGPRATFARSETVDWGVLFDFTVFHWDRVIIFPTYYGSAVAVGDADIYIYRLALGPEIKTGALSFYGGPVLLHATGDVDDETELGGYAGLSWHIDSSTSLTAEYQIYDDFKLFAVGLMHRFGETRPTSRPSEDTPWPRDVQRKARQRATPIGPKMKLLTDDAGEPVKDDKGNFIFVPVEE